MGELSRRLMVTGGNVTGLVDAARGRRPASSAARRRDDRRAHVVRLTPAGRAQFRAMAGRARALDRRAASPGCRARPRRPARAARRAEAIGARARTGRRRRPRTNLRGPSDEHDRPPARVRRLPRDALPLRAAGDGKVATITLDRPERKNPLTFESYAELRDLFRGLAYASDVRAVVRHRRGRQLLLRRRRARDHRAAHAAWPCPSCSPSRA